MILFFHDLYSCVKNFYHPLIAQFYSFMKNVSLNINFTFSQKLTFNAKLFILPWLFWWWSFGEDLTFFSCCLSSVYILWKDFHSSYDLYSCWDNLYHFSCWMIYTPIRGICAHSMIYTPIWGICIILLVIWFILPLGEFVSFC